MGEHGVDEKLNTFGLCNFLGSGGWQVGEVGEELNAGELDVRVGWVFEHEVEDTGDQGFDWISGWSAEMGGEKMEEDSGGMWGKRGGTKGAKECK